MACGATGMAVTEDSVCARLMVLTMPMPISVIQDIIDKGACHAALLSGEVQIGDHHGVVLQVTAATGCSVEVIACPFICIVNTAPNNPTCTRSGCYTYPALALMSHRSACQTMIPPTGLSNIVMAMHQQRWLRQWSSQMTMCHLRRPFHFTNPQAFAFIDDQTWISCLTLLGLAPNTVYSIAASTETKLRQNIGEKVHHVSIQ